MGWVVVGTFLWGYDGIVTINKYRYCGKPNAINPAFADDVYHPFMAISGIDSYWVYHIIYIYLYLDLNIFIYDIWICDICNTIDIRRSE
jgi:hypothetical protein